MVRQSANPKFRTYVENARWEIGDILFATIDLPANNNHYLLEAGRNSEFEDRLVANRNWLHQIFTYAKYKKLQGVVLFSDGDPISPPNHARSKRDGFAETRHQIVGSAAGFPAEYSSFMGRKQPTHAWRLAFAGTGNWEIWRLVRAGPGSLPIPHWCRCLYWTTAASKNAARKTRRGDLRARRVLIAGIL